MKTKLTTKLSIAAAALPLRPSPAPAVDLLARYPTQLTAGDAAPYYALTVEFQPGRHLSRLTF